jgi:hypothetical protein
VTLTLRGVGLDLLERAVVLHRGRAVREVVARLGPPSPTARHVILTADRSAPPGGDYQLQLEAKGRPSFTAPVTLEIAAPSARAPSGTAPLPGPGAMPGRTAPASPTPRGPVGSLGGTTIGPVGPRTILTPGLSARGTAPGSEPRMIATRELTAHGSSGGGASYVISTPGLSAHGATTAAAMVITTERLTAHGNPGASKR